MQLGLVLRTAHQTASRSAVDVLRPLGIEGRHLGVLMTLDRLGPLPQTRLGETLGSDKSAMVRTVDDLERLGAATRRSDPSDRRVNLVMITPLGRDLLARAQQLVGAAADELFGSLGQDEQQTLHDLLTRITRPAPRTPTPPDP